MASDSGTSPANTAAPLPQSFTPTTNRQQQPLHPHPGNTPGAFFQNPQYEPSSYHPGQTGFPGYYQPPFFPNYRSQTSNAALKPPVPFTPTQSWIPRSNGPQCQICSKVGHIALVCYNRDNKERYPPILPSTTSPPSYPYLDSGATHHMSPSLNSFTNSTPYQGHEQVLMGNGKPLSIAHIGNSILTSPLSSLKLNSVLHIPAISNKLVSVAKLCYENKAFVEFHPSFFLVKDLMTKQVLLQVHKCQKPFQLVHSNLWGPSPVTARFPFSNWISISSSENNAQTKNTGSQTQKQPP